MIEEHLTVAANPETDPEILRALSQSGDRTIRQAVAGNPNVPIEVLWELVAEFPNEIVANPLFSLITLENPNWIMDIPDDNFFELFKQSNVPEIFFSEVTMRGSDHARLNLLRYPTLPHQYIAPSLHLLSNDLRYRLLVAGEVQSAVLKQLAEKQIDNNHWQRRINEAVAYHPKTSKLILDSLIDGPYDSVRVNIATRNDLTKEMLIKLAIAPYPRIRKRLLSNPDIHSDLLMKLITHPDPRVQQFAQQHPNTSK
jgi:hypothetical protein